MTSGITVDVRTRADDVAVRVAVRNETLATKSRLSTFWAEPAPEGDAATVEIVWPMPSSCGQSLCNSRTQPEPQRACEIGYQVLRTSRLGRKIKSGCAVRLNGYKLSVDSHTLSHSHTLTATRLAAAVEKLTGTGVDGDGRGTGGRLGTKMTGGREWIRVELIDFELV